MGYSPASCTGNYRRTRRASACRVRFIPMDPLKDLLQRAQGGDQAAREQLFAVAYEELRSQARAQLRAGGRNTLLDTTVLVHESYLRFLRAGRLSGAERGHFFAYAAQVMRSVIVDSVRQRQAERRGGDAVHVPLDTRFADDVTANDEQVIKINDALESLEKLDERLVRVVEMRYFAGMTESEVAAALGVTDRTVRRDWQKARLLLAAALR
jgi:RNA polymerase sigma factor (TIGR02999 family)